MNKACDKRLARLTSYIHFTTGSETICDVRNSASECRSSVFQDADFTSDWKDSKSTSGEPHICSHELDMQDANSCSTQQYRSRYFSLMNHCLQQCTHPKNSSKESKNLVGVRCKKLANAWPTTQRKRTSSAHIYLSLYIYMYLYLGNYTSINIKI